LLSIWLGGGKCSQCKIQKKRGTRMESGFLDSR
jgi:hypothetical protein